MNQRIFCLVLAGWLLAPGIGAAGEDGPCSGPEYGQFDFWIGTWDVTLADGTPAGTNRIEKILNDCVIFENWKSAKSAYAGKSFNTYDPLTKTWNQVWVDTTGATIPFQGTRTGNVMTMAGTRETAEGTVHNRMSYTVNPDGTVRQVWQQSRDGEEWTTVFDGLYRRSQDAPAQ